MGLSAKIAALLVGAAALISPVSPPPGLGETLIERGSRGDTIWLNLDPIMRTTTWLWDNASANEYIGCVQGTMVGDTVVASAIELADMNYSDSVSASGWCRQTESFIGRIHPHTGPDQCGQSWTDRDTFLHSPASAWDFISCGREAIWVSFEKVPNTEFLYIDKLTESR